MDKKTRFNMWYWIAALIGILILDEADLKSMLEPLPSGQTDAAA
jgi:hypothetical protein